MLTICISAETNIMLLDFSSKITTFLQEGKLKINFWREINNYGNLQRMKNRFQKPSVAFDMSLES